MVFKKPPSPEDAFIEKMFHHYGDHYLARLDKMEEFANMFLHGDWEAMVDEKNGLLQ